jgi:Putative auto-transporter adhesin, head GIN domain
VVTISATALTALDASDSAIAHADKVEGGSVSVSSNDSAAVTVDAVIGDRVTIAASDSGALSVDSVNCDRLSIAASDSAVLKAGAITAPDGIDISCEDSAIVEARGIAAEDSVSVTVEDSSVAVLDGSAPALSAALSDSSELDARDFEAKKVTIVASSSSAAEVCATASIEARLSDSSAVLYTCDPDKVTKTLDDSSTLDEN